MAPGAGDGGALTPCAAVSFPFTAHLLQIRVGPEPRISVRATTGLVGASVVWVWGGNSRLQVAIKQPVSCLFVNG